jgi:hypothetical protein
MNFDGNFIQRGQVDVAPLQALVAAESDVTWRADPFRQRAFTVHGDTETLFLIYDQDLRHISPTRLPRYDDYSRALQPVFDVLAAGLCESGWCARCILTRLRPGGVIAPHVDHGFSLERSHRVHIPIVTSGDVRFEVGGEVRNMAAGEMWEINNMRRHGVENTGDHARVHLIVDWACLGMVMARL